MGLKRELLSGSIKAERAKRMATSTVGYTHGIGAILRIGATSFGAKQFQCAYALIILCMMTSLAGCVALLPRGQTATQESWPDFESAQAAVERIVPHQSRRAEIAALGFDPYKNPTITILNYSDILQRFVVSGTMKREELDPGILECLKAGKACTGYAILVRSSIRKRTGGFWMDILNFRRVTDITGWTFNALILMVDDLVVYTLHGGQPRIHEQEVTRNPLGPVQESVPSLLKLY